VPAEGLELPTFGLQNRKSGFPKVLNTNAVRLLPFKT
jgi:hypothetical protein